MNGKYQVGSGRIVTFTHDTPFINDTVSQSDNGVKMSARESAQAEQIYSDRDSDGYGGMTYADISAAQQKLFAEERELEDRKRKLSDSPELVKAMDEYSDLFSDMKGLLSKRRSGKATQEELDRIEKIKSKRDEIDAINAKHDAAMLEMQEAHKAEIADLNRQWDAEAAAMEKSHKYDLEEQERIYKERLKKVRETMNHDAEAELEKVIGQYRDQRKASVENRHRTQYREQIYKMADKFHKMATAPAKANVSLLLRQ